MVFAIRLAAQAKVMSVNRVGWCRLKAEDQLFRFVG